MIERRRAGKAYRWRRRQREVGAAADLGDRGLDAARCNTAALVLRIGNACEFDTVWRRAIPQAKRLQAARAINAQQREVVVLVLGDAIGIAVAGDRDRQAAVGDLAGGDDGAVLTYR